MGDRPAAAVTDERHAIGQGIDHGNHRVDVNSKADVCAVRVAGLKTSKGERVNRVSGVLQWPGHFVPRRAIEPEAGDEDDIHASRIRGTARQASGARLVTDTMLSISAVVEENTASTEDMAAQSAQVSEAIHEIAASAHAAHGQLLRLAA